MELTEKQRKCKHSGGFREHLDAVPFGIDSEGNITALGNSTRSCLKCKLRMTGKEWTEHFKVNTLKFMEES